MKKIFKLAAIAVSMALVTSLVACSSGDDDVVDATTPKYLLQEQIKQYVDSIKYDQNVSDGKIDEKKNEIKSFKDAHEAVMKIIGDCEDCLAAYFKKLKGIIDDNKDDFSSSDIEDAIEELAYLKSYGKEEEYHKVYVYKPAIEEALKAVSDAEDDVDDIGNPDGNTILDGKLNARQSDSMKAYTDAFAALKSALNESDSKRYENKFKAADKVIEDFYKLNENVKEKEKEKGKVDVIEIAKVTAAVDVMRTDIQTNVCDKIEKLPRN